MDELERIAGELGLRLDTAEREPLLALACELVALAVGGEPAAGDGQHGGPAAARAPVASLAEGNERDPLGAVVRWCDAEPLGEGPLSGRHVSVKDSIAVGGVPMSCGMRMLERFVPERDSVVVARLRQAGARIVAITNMDALGMAASGETSAFGITRNPHDRARSAGGSSSGAAAGLAYDSIDLALGTDQGGSIRVPASWCGVLGLKPTHALVPYTGNAGIDPLLDHVGPLARSAADLAALLDAIAGADPSDPRQRGIAVERRDYGASVADAPDRLDGLRVGMLAEGLGAAVGVEPAVAAAARETAERLALLGASVRDVSVPGHTQVASPSALLNAEGIAAVLDGRASAEGAARAGFARALAAALQTRAGELSPHVKASWIAGTLLRRRRAGSMPAPARAARRTFRAAYDRALGEVDLLLMPTTPFPAFVPPCDGDVRGLLERGWAMLTNTEPFNLTGHPAISLPAGTVAGASGPLPVGTMLVGRWFEDDVLLRVAAAYERAHGWWTPRAKEAR